MSTQLEIQSVIRLEKIHFPILNFKSSGLIIHEDILDGANMNLSYDVLFAKEEDNDTFVVKFDLNLKANQEKESFEANVSMSALFSSDKSMGEDFRNSDFVQVNAPAIAFPYLRSFVTNITTQAGYKPLILPVINLTLMKKKEDDN